MDTHSKLMVVLASAALGLGLAGCAGSADASAPTYKVPTISDMDREKQVLNAERDKKIARDFAARVKAEAEAKAKAEAEAKAKAEAAAQAQAGSGAAARSGTSARSYQPKARTYQPKARPGRSARSGGGGGDISNEELQRRINDSISRSSKAHEAKTPKDNRVLCTQIGDYIDCH